MENKMTQTPKEKGLIEKFSPLVTTWDCYWDAPRNEDDIISDAKLCALVCVGEMIEQCEDSNFGWFSIYWKEVRTEFLMSISISLSFPISLSNASRLLFLL